MSPGRARWVHRTVDVTLAVAFVALLAWWPVGVVTLATLPLFVSSWLLAHVTISDHTR